LPPHIQGGVAFQGKALSTGTITQSGQPVTGNTVLKLLTTTGAGGAKQTQVVGTNASGQQIVQISSGQQRGKKSSISTKPLFVFKVDFGMCSSGTWEYTYN